MELSSGRLQPRFLPPGRLPGGREPLRFGAEPLFGFHPPDDGLSAEPPGLGLERGPEAGFPGGPKLGLGFQPVRFSVPGRSARGRAEGR